jgi:hypothetical protein
LRRHFALSERASQLEQTVGQGGFAVVDVRYDAVIPDELGIHGSFCVERSRFKRDCLRASIAYFKLSSVP